MKTIFDAHCHIYPDAISRKAVAAVDRFYDGLPSDHYDGTASTLLESGALAVIHPDLLTAGGIAETKKVGDYAEERGVQMSIHMAESPIAAMAASTASCFAASCGPIVCSPVRFSRPVACAQETASSASSLIWS